MEVSLNNKLVPVKTNQQYITYFKLLLCCSTGIAAAKSMQSSLTYVDSSAATIIVLRGKNVSQTGQIFHDLFKLKKYVLLNVDP